MQTLFEVTESIQCPICKSAKIKRNGTIGLEQRYYCKNCHKSFTQTLIFSTTPATTNPDKDNAFCTLSKKLSQCSKVKDIETDENLIMGCERCVLKPSCIEWWDIRVCELASTHLLDEFELNILEQEFIEMIGVWG